MSKKCLILCRHGYRDDLNPNSLLFNPGLTSFGIAQVKLLSKALKQYKISNMIVSPYLRTLETAKYVSDVLKVQFTVDYGVAEWLNELWMTEYPRLYTKSEIEELYSNACFEAPLTDVKYEYPESLSQLKKRCQSVSNALQKINGTTLIITHGRVLSEICSNLTNYTYDFFRTDICCITILEKSDKEQQWNVIQNGSIKHITKYLKFIKNDNINI